MEGQEMEFLLASLLVMWILVSELAQGLTEQEKRKRNELKILVKERKK